MDAEAKRELSTELRRVPSEGGDITAGADGLGDHSSLTIRRILKKPLGKLEGRLAFIGAEEKTNADLVAIYEEGPEAVKAALAAESHDDHFPDSVEIDTRPLTTVVLEAADDLDKDGFHREAAFLRREIRDYQAGRIEPEETGADHAANREHDRETLQAVIRYMKSAIKSATPSPAAVSRPASEQRTDDAGDRQPDLSAKSSGEHAPRSQREQSAEPSELFDEVEHSDDFRSMRWFGVVYSFTANQAPVVGLLFDHWQRGVPEVGDETLLSAVDPEAPPARLSTLFRNHPAWGTVIAAGGSKGTHRLVDPKEEKP